MTLERIQKNLFCPNKGYTGPGQIKEENRGSNWYPTFTRKTAVKPVYVYVLPLMLLP